MVDRVITRHEIVGWLIFSSSLGSIAWITVTLIFWAAHSYEVGGNDGLVCFVTGVFCTLMAVYMTRVAFKMGEVL